MTESPAKLPPQAGQEIGGSGTYIFKGYITAEEYSRDLQGRYGLQMFDVMRKSDPVIRAALTVCKAPILGANFDLMPASTEPKDVEIADDVRRELFEGDISFHDSFRESLTFLEFGFYVGEIVFAAKTYQGRSYIGLAKIAPRKQRSILNWEIDGGKLGVTQILPTGQSPQIPRDKLLHIANDQEGENYQGVSLLRYAYKPWKIKDALDIILAVSIERTALGVPLITKNNGGQTTDEGELQKVRSLLQQLRTNEKGYIEIPDGLKLEAFDLKSKSTDVIIPALEHLNSEITLSVLAQFLMLGQGKGGSGSRAVSQDHSSLFIKSLAATAETARLSWQRDVINRFVDLNYSDLPNGYPKLVISNISDEDVAKTSNAVGTLMTAGAIHADADLENKLRKNLMLPKLSEDMYDNYEDITKPVVATDPNNDVNPSIPAKDVPKNVQEESLPKDGRTKAAVIEGRRARDKLMAAILQEE